MNVPRNPLTHRWPEPSWKARYELLRQNGLRSGSRFRDAEGLVVLQRRGMLSWIAEASARTRPRSTSPSLSRQRHDVVLRPGSVDVTRLLATMVEAASAAEEQG